MKPNSNKPSALRLAVQGVPRPELIFFAAVCAACVLMFSHVDVLETANHSYLFLENLFSGHFLNYYEFIAAHSSSLYYLNNAHYNILMYILFAVWELPLFLLNKVVPLPLDVLLAYWAKFLPLLFFAGCGWQVRQLGRLLGLDEGAAVNCSLFFLFSPVAFFSAGIMGQYDTLCLFFMLWGLCWYLKGDLPRFALIFGMAAVCKFFAFLVFLPLLLLAEKKLLRLLKYGLMSLWLYLPTTLLFLGRTGDASAFTREMFNRLFVFMGNTGLVISPMFVLAYAACLFAAYLYTPATPAQRDRFALWLCLATFAWLFNCIYWHPQWLVLLMPFIVLTNFLEKNRVPWVYLDLVFAAGFFLMCYSRFGQQMGGMMFSGGILGTAFGMQIVLQEAWQPLNYFVGLVPYLPQMTPVLFTAPLLLHIVLKFPVGGKTLASRLSTQPAFDNFGTRTLLYGTFGVGLGLFWLVPSLLEFLNAFGYI